MKYVRTVDNYSFVNEEGAMVDITKNKRGRVFLKGKSNEWSVAFPWMDEYVTSAVCKFTEEGEVITKYNHYKLGTISPDYQEFLNVTRMGTLALGNWNIYGSRNGNYYLTGDIFPQKKSIEIAKIIHQEGNFLTIQQLVEERPGKLSWCKPERIFVCWCSVSRCVIQELDSRGKIADIPYQQFEKFNGTICKPILKI